MTDAEEYDVVKSEAIAVLINRVRERTRTGDWKPFGGVAATVDSEGGKWFYQAIVRGSLVSDVEEK